MEKTIKSAAIENVAKAIRAAWDKHGDVPFPLYENEARAMAEAAINAIREMEA